VLLQVDASSEAARGLVKSRVKLFLQILIPLRISPVEYREIPADVIVYIFAHLHRALRTEGNIDYRQLKS